MKPDGTANPYWTTEDPTYPVSDWKLEVQNDDTRLGYWDWVDTKTESEDDDEQ